VIAPDSALILAGFVLAHAAWSVSDLPKGQLLVPLAIVEKDGKRQLHRFEAATQEQAIVEGKAALAKQQPNLDAWAFAREGLISEAGGKVDVITVDVWAKGMQRPISLIQKFTPYSSGTFRINGTPIVVIDGKIVDVAEAAPYVVGISKGVQQHTKVAPLWDRWQAK
jgi:hypothetical protein